MIKHYVVTSLCVLLVLAVPCVTYALNVSGTVQDSNNVGIPGMRIEVYDEDTFVDDLIQTVYTGVPGNFLTSAASAGDDIYIIAKWEFRLLPTAFYGDHVVRLVDVVPGSAMWPARVFTNVRQPASGSYPNIQADLVIPTFQMGQAQLINSGGNPAHPQLVSLIQAILDYYRLNGAAVGWNMNYDVPVHIRTDNAAFAAAEASIPTDAFTGFNLAGNPLSFEILTVYHELAHLVHYYHNGMSFPPRLPGCANHTINSEEDPGCGLVEGWASYVGVRVDMTQGAPANDPFYYAYQDTGSVARGFPPFSIWRGNEAARTGRDPATSTFESGEVVEGANAGVWFSIHNDPLFSFGDNLRVFLDDRPNHMLDFSEGFAGDFGSNTQQVRNMYQYLQQHGIVYSRARFIADPFSAPQSTGSGSAKKIKDLMYLRGTVKTKFEAVSKTDLGVNDVISIDKIQVRWKAPAADLNDNPNQFLPANATSFVSFGLISHEIDIDTTAMGDGEWDLLIIGENDDGFIDNFLPAWAPNPGTAPADPGDGNTTVNTEEKYLKVLGSWYDEDRDPNTYTIDQGKVVVDNTIPAASIQIKKTP